ncbi:hypothetical protein E2562_031972 [Oryza meyeriana var. granulata]|uniref:Uncharacterized protein n=1 Tax=Oryza meyeriana var. granulata TaxID=110450 RepID=A0A6G1F089_9ORYZ|nr:hypothetical protein E2562_031972 [Oryza meyeriana var. granulata]
MPPSLQSTGGDVTSNLGFFASEETTITAAMSSSTIGCVAVGFSTSEEPRRWGPQGHLVISCGQYL